MSLAENPFERVYTEQKKLLEAAKRRTILKKCRWNPCDYSSSLSALMDENKIITTSRHDMGSLSTLGFICTFCKLACQKIGIFVKIAGAVHQYGRLISKYFPTKKKALCHLKSENVFELL